MAVADGEKPALYCTDNSSAPARFLLPESLICADEPSEKEAPR